MSTDPIPVAASSKRLVLFLAANPTNTEPLRLDEEVRAIREQLQRSGLALDSCWAVRPWDVQKEILRLKPQIVHFSGHGMGEPVATNSDHRLATVVGASSLHDLEGLAFVQDTLGRSVLVGSEALAHLFENFKNHVECVVLNGCYSEVQAKAIAQHIPYVIGMQEAILDRSAIEFSKGFYNALAEGEPIERAFALGKTAIELAGMPDFQFPVLHQHTNVPRPTDVNSAQFKSGKLKPKRLMITGGIFAALLSSAFGIATYLRTRPLSCFEQAKKEGKLVVAIAPFQRDPSNQNTASSIENLLADRLEKSQPSISTCTTQEPIKTESEARKLGNKLESTLVVWGSQFNPLMLAVGVTTVKRKVGDLYSLNITAKNEQDFNNQLAELPPLVGIMAAYALSEMDLDHDNAFQNALEYARAKKPDPNNQNNIQVLSKGYFWLGLLYMPSPADCRLNRENCLKAIDSYKNAIKINPTEELAEAYMLLGINQSSLGKISDAIQTYTDLINIDPNSENALEAKSLRDNLISREKSRR
jgi:tetratricopeptide (TPR) repeat protein